MEGGRDGGRKGGKDGAMKGDITIPQSPRYHYLECCNDQFPVSTAHLSCSSILPEDSKQPSHNTMNVCSEGREGGAEEREEAVE